MLTDDSATESDSISRDPDTGQQGGCFFAFKDGDIRDEDLCAKALHAIDQIRFFDIATVERDATLHEVILGAANTLLHFLNRVCFLPSREWCMTVSLYLFPHLANARFLSILFLHRSACRVVATQADASTAVVAVVCWVDIVLAKLATFILLVAGGLAPHFSALNDSDLLKSRREDDSVHAATQLPERWESLIDVVGSDTASPAAIRLATRLLFAALVMGPQLNGDKHWVDSRIHPQRVISAILRNTERKSTNGLFVDSARVDCDDEERTGLAMLVVIFSAGHAAQKRDQAQTYQLLARIQSLSRLLDVLQITINRDMASCSQLTHPCVNLDMAQTVLVRWGNLVPWSWSTWNDQRLANVECITDLTITWLYHLNTPFCTSSSRECLPVFSFDFDSIISSEESSFVTIITQIFNRIMLQIMRVAQTQTARGISADLAVVLRKTCSVTIQLLHHYTNRRTASYEQIVRSICWPLQALFCWLGGKMEDLHIKDIILEIISLMPTDIVISSFHALCEDNHFELEERIDKDVLRFIEIVDLWDDNLSDSDVVSTCFGIKYTVIFLTLIWHGDLDGYISTQSVLCLNSKVMDLLGKSRDDRVISILEAATLTFASIASCFAASGTLSPMEDELFWDLAIRSKYTDLSIASAFAHRILMTRSQIDSLSLAEAWDHLRNVLLVILGGCFTEDEGTLALLVCPGICMALTKLVQIDSYASMYLDSLNFIGIADILAEFIMSSPWTISLEAELNSLILADCSTERYFLALQQELKGPGKVLSNQLANKKPQLSENNEMSQVIPGWCPVYYYTTTGSHIVLVSPESVKH